MKTITEELETIWNADYYAKGKRYFWLYNYTYFRILDEAEFKKAEHSLHPDKKIFAVADATNGDREEEAYLFFDKNSNSGVFIQSNYRTVQPVEIKKIADSLSTLFGKLDASEILIEERQPNFWSWFERMFHEYDIDTVPPKGVLPGYDLRRYFKDLPDTFVSSHDEVNVKEFIKYFSDFGIDNLDTQSLFQSRPEPQTLREFVGKINDGLPERTFFVASFNPSASWGIGNLKSLTAEQKKQLEDFGLLY